MGTRDFTEALPPAIARAKPGADAAKPKDADAHALVLRSLAKELRQRVRGEVRFDDATRAIYSTDGSNYRQVPLGAVIPLDAGDVEATFAACRRYGVPILSRGGGTSLAGQCCNVAVVLDFSKRMNRVLELDAAQRWARVQPGTVLDVLRAEAKRFELTFGPDPSTHNHCTLGGMIGNNSCGVHSVMAGRTVDNVHELEVLLYDGTRMWVGPTKEDELARIIEGGGRRGEIYAKLRALRDRYADLIRARYPKIPRRVSGYSLDELLPENGFNVARALVGSEATCVSVLEARVRLVDNPPVRSLLVLGYPSVYEAADHVMEVRASGCVGLEGLDDVLLDHMKRKGIHREDLSLLPEGKGFLVVEFGGHSKRESDDQARALMERLKAKSDAPTMKLYDDAAQEEHIWKVRESGLGATARVPGEQDTWEGWEDSAVPPERLGEYLRSLRALFVRYDYQGALYGHFGDGCVHTRINFGLTTKEGIAKYRSFVEEAADLVVRLGGSLSGEHGDGQSRGELLEKMYGPELVQAFREFKAIWDPDGKMNPGKKVDPYRLDENLRLGAGFQPATPETHFHYPDDKGSLGYAAMRCVGIGECRRDEHGTMCPSYRVTREEMHSTRGRAHLLFEMLQNGATKGGWRDDGVKEALDLCLACKGCKTDCPMNVDMATYKAEFFSHYYEGRLRPRHAYAMGWIHRWARLAQLAPNIVNLFTQTPGLSALFKRVGGVAAKRRIPPFAPRSFKRMWKKRRMRAAVPSTALGTSGSGAATQTRGPALLWADTFNNYFHPHTALAATEVLERLGFEVEVPKQTLCCGRPLYDFGMLRTARALLAKVLDALEPYLRRGTPIVVLEPSCYATFKDEMLNLFPKDPRAKRLASQVYLLAELLEERAKDETLPLFDREIVVHGHCHQKAIAGTEAEKKVLHRLGAKAEILDDGCCGMAGSFGYAPGEPYRVSVDVGELKLLPAVREAGKQTVLMADGFSCRSQIEQQSERRALHLAEVLGLAMKRDDKDAQRPIEEVALKGTEYRAARGLRSLGLLLTAGVAGVWAWSVFQRRNTKRL